MIFVTLGTHEQPFNRLIEGIDRLVTKRLLNEPVFIQLGFSTYIPKSCDWAEMLPYQEMMEKIREARIVIAHGGDTLMEILSMGKIPVAVPRQARFGEHVDDHQVRFVRRLEEMNKVLAVYEIDRLKEVILNYENLSQKCRSVVFQSSERQKLIQNLITYCQSLRPA